jgi:hypothetical protein
MRDLGKIQAEVMDRLRKALASTGGDSHVLGVLGPVAAEMDRKGADWEAVLNHPPNGNPTPHVSTGPVPNTNGTNFAGRDIYEVTILGSSVQVGSYKEALFAVLERLQAAHHDFDQIAPSIRGQGLYFSENKSDLRKGERIRNSKLFVETNFAGDRIWKICTDLVRRFGHDPNDKTVLHFDAAAQRTRAVNRRSRRRP